MCIAIHKPAKIELDEVIYRNSFARNDHGAGIAYVENGKLVIDKGIMDIDEFVTKVKALEQHELIIHCRVMSKGKISADNCHPFHVSSEMFPEWEYAVIHNGTLNWKSTAERSDTSHFVEEFIKPVIDRDPYFFNHPQGRAMLGAYIGSTNKMVVLSLDKEERESAVRVINKQEGIMFMGCWFSNMSFTDEYSRHIYDSDRKRIDTWKPKLWVDKTSTPVANSYIFPGMEDDDERGPVANSSVGDKISTTDFQNGSWKHDTTFGFGWYNSDPKYVGARSLNKFEEHRTKTLAEWDRKSKTSKSGADASKHDSDHDKMEYLTDTERKQARRECIKILQTQYADTKFKDMSDQEVCAWARAELRLLIPALTKRSNEKLMRIIITGKAI